MECVSHGVVSLARNEWNRFFKTVSGRYDLVHHALCSVVFSLPMLASAQSSTLPENIIMDLPSGSEQIESAENAGLEIYAYRVDSDSSLQDVGIVKYAISSSSLPPTPLEAINEFGISSGIECPGRWGGLLELESLENGATAERHCLDQESQKQFSLEQYRLLEGDERNFLIVFGWTTEDREALNLDSEFWSTITTDTERYFDSIRFCDGVAHDPCQKLMRDQLIRNYEKLMERRSQ